VKMFRGSTATNRERQMPPTGLDPNTGEESFVPLRLMISGKATFYPEAWVRLEKRIITRPSLFLNDLPANSTQFRLRRVRRTRGVESSRYGVCRETEYSQRLV